MTNDNGMTPILQSDDTQFFKQVADLLMAARKYAKKQLDSTIATTYYEVGRMIVEREQQGLKRAKYGAKLLKGLSVFLTDLYGRGFSIENLQNIRKFYIVYAQSIQQTLSTKSAKGQLPTALSENQQSLISDFDTNTQKQQTLSTKSQKRQTLSSQFNLS